MNMISADLIDFSLYSKEPEGFENVKPAADLVREMRASLGKPQADPGHKLPWDKANHFKFREGELTLWAGVNGHGKSQLTGFIAADLIAARQRVCIASMEMKPQQTLIRMIRQWTGFDPHAEWAQHPEAVAQMRDLYTDFETQCRDLMWIYDQRGTVKTEIMLGVARYCARKLKIKHFFIDSLMKCVRGADDYNAQKDFVSELFSIGRDYGMHIHLIHHIRKLENEAKIPDKMDIKGAGEITDIADNVLIVWRNKTDASKRKAGDFDAVLNCCKQRNGAGWEGKIGLYYDQESQQYSEAPGEKINFAERAM